MNSYAQEATTASDSLQQATTVEKTVEQTLVEQNATQGATVDKDSMQETSVPNVTAQEVTSDTETLQETTVANEPECTVLFTPSDQELYQFKDLRLRYSLEPYEGIRIKSINISSLDVFNENDDNENNVIYTTLNALHINTRQRTVRQQLLFEEGEPLSMQKLNESLRILRQKGYLIDALAVPLSVCADGLDLMIITRDVWTFEPQINFSHKNGQSKSGVGISDSNIFGTGNHASVNYSHRPERDSMEYSFSSPHLFGTRLSSEVKYADNSDGRKKKFVLSRPFFSLDSKWSAGVFLRDESTTEIIHDGTEEINSWNREKSWYSVSYGTSKGLINNTTHRWTFGFNAEADRFTENSETLGEIPDDRIVNYPWVEFERIEDAYGKYTNINYLNQTEDIFLGRTYKLRIGHADPNFGADNKEWIFNAQFENTVSLGAHHLVTLHSQLDGSYINVHDQFENTVFANEITYEHIGANDKDRLFLSLSFDAGTQLTSDSQLTLGGTFNLRGYPADYQSGDRRYKFTAEKRYFTDIHLFNLVRVAGVVFFDTGSAWTAGDGGSSTASKPISDVGFGLRMASSKARKSNVIHLDLAFPLNDRDEVDSYQWILEAEERF